MAKDFTETNRAYFDDLAAVYDTKPDFKVLLAQTVAFIHANLEFISPKLHLPSSTSSPSPSSPLTGATTLHLLDYACGTGTITNALGPAITHATGIDLSPNMVAAYNKRFAPSALADSPMPHLVAHATVGNLLASDAADAHADEDVYADAEPKFDIAAVGMGFHHFAAPETAVARLAARLRPGGVLFVIDFCAAGHDRTADGAAGVDVVAAAREAGHPAADTISQRHGFSEEDMLALFGGAGLVRAGYRVMPEDAVVSLQPHLGPQGKTVRRRVFLARAERTG